ncbi:uncharacterized protein LOC111083281 [Limulus polyphemus]|uniref:Uncharacterized protein LOC111083281 n=1 Tax=Limulus polyphemus TaxID=6850 RepID=A0ABM1RVI0_LIMPO|nr:uncharacterized protein LOC111083281 [Limulus polyphemus]
MNSDKLDKITFIHVGKPRFHPDEVRATGNQIIQDQRSSSFKSSRQKAQGSEKRDTSKALQKAFQNNPYYKYHQKYNPDLVGDDQQELASHLRARRNRTRRLTLSALSRGLKSNASSVNDIDYRSSSEPGSISQVIEPQHQPLNTSLFYQSLTDDPLFDSATNIFLERAQRRRSIMSGKSTYGLEHSASTDVSSPTTANHSARLERQQALSGSRESISEDHLAAIFEIIKEELEPTDGSINDSENHKGRTVRIVTPVTPDKTDDTLF